MVGKDSGVRDVLLATSEKLLVNGAYALIMKKWGLESNMLSAPGINLGGKTAK